MRGIVILGVIFSFFVSPALRVLAGEMPLGEPHVYREIEGRELKLYVVSPPQGSDSPSSPALVFFHGGGWVSGSPRVFNPQAEHLASLGVTCILVEYRLLKGMETPEACIQDAKSAMRWVRSHAKELGIDPNRIVASGGSAGGHLAACTGMIAGFDDPGDDLKVSAKPQAIILYNSVIDNGPGGYGYRRVQDRYMEFSPIHNIRPGVPPVLFLLGSEDKLIPVSTGELFKRKMDEVGVRCDLHIFEGMPHSFFHPRYGGKEGYQKALDATLDFLVSLGWIDRRENK